MSRFTQYIKDSNHRTIQLSKVIDGYRLLENKYRSILSCARHMFGIAITCIEHLTQIKDGQKKADMCEMSAFILSLKKLQNKINNS